MQTVSLLDKTRELLKSSKIPLPQIYKDTGLSFYWLRKFKSGEFDDPSVNKVQTLYEYLTGTSVLR